MPLNFPLKMLSTYVSDNPIISMPDGLGAEELTGLFGMYGIQPAGGEVWLMLRGDAREKAIITGLKDLGAKVRGLGVMGAKLEFIF
jgi:hypothetical protein